MSVNIKYCGHEYIKVPDPNRKYTGFIYKCIRCKYHTKLLQILMEAGVDILTCDERIIQNIIE